MSKLNLGKDLYIKGRIGWQGLNKNEYLAYSEYKIINATALMDEYVDWDNCGYISKERYEEAKEIQLEENDILISKDGTLGKIGYIKNLKGKCSVASGIFVVRNTAKDKIDFDYLYHILKSNIFKDFIHRNKSQGSTIPHLYQRDLENFELDVPSLKEQQRVAKVLKQLDSKITINNKINDNLQQQAKLLYDYWFNQFEFPNEEGKPYKSSGGKMVWNEELKREIPEGWEVKKILDTDIYVSDYTANGSFKGLANNVKYGEGIPYAMLIRIIDFNNNFEKENDHIWINKHGYDYLSKSNLYGDEIIICNVGAVGNVYRCPRLKCPMTLGPNGIVVNHEYLNNYLELYFSSTIGQYQLHSISSGSIQLKFNKTNFRDLYIPIPNKSIIDVFYKTYNAIYEKKNSIWNENKILSSLRDWLLPMLMNGQATVKEQQN